MQVRQSLFLLFAVPVLAQEAAGNGEFVIRGEVVDSVHDSAIGRALVRLVPRNRRGPAYAFADVLGRFSFSALPAGTYSLSAEKPGYSSTDTAAAVTVGPSAQSIAIRLEPLGVIKGRILDAFGDPISGVIVHALQPLVEKGRRRMEMSRWARSNDRGDYRIWDLPRGKYYVRAMGRAARTLLYVGELPATESDEAFTPVYYGGGENSAAAVPVAVEPGAEVQADVTLNLQPGRTITGAVINAVPYRETIIELLRGDEDIAGGRAAINAADGRFRIQDVVDGSYTLRITQGTEDERTRAIQPLQIAGRSMNGVIVRLSPGLSVTGTIRIDGTLRPAEEALYQVSLHAIDGPIRRNEDDADYDAEIGPDLKFRIAGVLAGRYSVEVQSFSAYVASVTSGEQDLLGDGVLTIGPMAPPAPIEIVLRKDGAEVGGTVAVGNKPVSANVALFPTAFSERREIITTLTSTSGTFAFRMVPPGEYRIVAWRLDSAEPEYADPEVNRALAARGQPLQVAPGGRHTVSLTDLWEAGR